MSENQNKDVEMKDEAKKEVETKAPEQADPFFGKVQSFV